MPRPVCVAFAFGALTIGCGQIAPGAAARPAPERYVYVPGPAMGGAVAPSSNGLNSTQPKYSTETQRAIDQTRWQNCTYHKMGCK